MEDQGIALIASDKVCRPKIQSGQYWMWLQQGPTYQAPQGQLE